LQDLKDKSNVIFMGTGSKTLSTNIGFVACDDASVIEYLKVMSPSYMFTNAINSGGDIFSEFAHPQLGTW
jgi:glycine C-acetyltransferase